MSAAMHIEHEPREAPRASAGQVMPRQTAELIVHQRNAALKLYGQAHDALTAAADVCKAASAAVRTINPSENRFNYHLHGQKAQFMHVSDVQEREAYMAVARRIADTEAWSRILEITNLERLMDKQAKDQLRQDLMSDPPAATVENIYATLERFVGEADTIFRRGIANCFSKLDRRFRSHDGFKIGSRVILDRMFDENGWWNYNRGMEDVLLDIERTFLVVDGLDVPPSYSGIVGKLRDTKSRRSGAHQAEVESEFFTVRVFKNGNAHVWFKRDDLVEKVNKLLAEYYGEVIPDGMTPEDDGGLFEPKTSLARNYGFFPTPKDAVDRVLDKVPLYRGDDEPLLTVLEPSAGGGNLARPIANKLTGVGYDKKLPRAVALVDCVEVQPTLAESLRRSNIYRRVYGVDFLALKPSATGLYDRVVMNPPFDRERDIDHVIHALDFLKPSGFLLAIMSAGTEFRETRKSVAFRALIAKMHGKFDDLPAGSFSSVGTNVNTIYLRVWKDGRTFY